MLPKCSGIGVAAVRSLAMHWDLLGAFEDVSDHQFVQLTELEASYPPAVACLAQDL